MITAKGEAPVAHASTEEEAQDLLRLGAEQLRIKDACFSYLDFLSTADEEQLRISGYSGKTNAEAMKMAFTHYKKKLDKALQKHLEKWPD